MDNSGAYILKMYTSSEAVRWKAVSFFNYVQIELDQFVVIFL